MHTRGGVIAAAAAGLLAWLLPIPAHAQAATWQQWLSIPGIFDLGGPMADGSLTAAAGGKLVRLSPDGRVTPVAPGYSVPAGPEAYIAVSPGLHLPSPGCDFQPGDVFALQLSPPLGVTRVDAAGQVTLFASIPGVDGLNGIVFDTAGRFGYRLLVTGPKGSQSVVAALDCQGTVTTVTSAAPTLEGGLAVAPIGFGAHGGELIAPDELSGRILAIAPDGTSSLLVDSGLPGGQDLGVESAGFVPAGFSSGGFAHLADRATPGGAHPGTDSVLRLDSSSLVAAGVRDGDLLLATEGGAATVDVRCASTCTATQVAVGSAVAHGEGHLSFTLTGSCRSPQASPPQSIPGPGQTTFDFAEGFTGTGFVECLGLFSPRVSGVATIDYFTEMGHLPTSRLWLWAGQPAAVNVNGAVGAGHQVSARVTLPGPGVVERTMHFQFGSWHGSTGKVGASQAALEWDFAEGSTLAAFHEFLTLENVNTTPTPATLSYFLDTGAHPVKTLVLPASSRTTVEVFNGGPFDVSACVPNSDGASCGVGRGWGGVAVKVTSSQPLIVERPMYVNGNNFGSGPVSDGHVALGANGAASQWSFAEGSTLPGFNEYLTLANSGPADASVNLNYQDEQGTQTVKSLVVKGLSRSTVEAFSPQLGVGAGVGGVSVQVSSDQPIVAERPMYIYHDFGSGVVAGAHVVVGSRQLSKVYGFASASTVSGENDYLTLQNPGTAGASVIVKYYGTGPPVLRTLQVAAASRATVEIFAAAAGTGPGFDRLGITVESDQPLLVEKPTYSANPSTYGATDTLGVAVTAF